MLMWGVVCVVVKVDVSNLKDRVAELSRLHSQHVEAQRSGDHIHSTYAESLNRIYFYKYRKRTWLRNL